MSALPASGRAQKTVFNQRIDQRSFSRTWPR